jgi:hypothetical protein
MDSGSQVWWWSVKWTQNNYLRNITVFVHDRTLLNKSITEIIFGEQYELGVGGCALCYMPERRGLDSRAVIQIFYLPNPSGRTMDLRST